MSTKLVSLAKTTRPSFSGVLPRDRLFAMLDASQKSVIWVTGPPGCGKTTLVASYLDNELDADLYLRLPRATQDHHWIWDHAAGSAIVRAAGGTVSDIDGSPLDFSFGRTLARNKGMIVSNGRFHDDVVRAIETARSAS